MLLTLDRRADDDRPGLAAFTAPVPRQIIDGLADTVGDSVNPGGLSGSADRDVPEFASAARARVLTSAALALWRHYVGANPEPADHAGPTARHLSRREPSRMTLAGMRGAAGPSLTAGAGGGQP